MATAADTKSFAGHELVITRVFDAPRKLVFEVWTDPRHLKNWFGPKDYPAVQMKTDIRPGGAWRACMFLNRPEAVRSLGWAVRVARSPRQTPVFTFRLGGRGRARARKW